MLLQITYHDKAIQTETEEKDTIEKILKAITTLCTKVDSMDNEIQKLKTNEDNLKSKASQQHDYKNSELRRSEDGKNPELKGDDGKLLKTHNVCLNTVVGTSKQVSDKQHKNVNLNQLFEKPFTQRTPRHMSMEPQISTDVDRYNKLIARPKTNANLVRTCYNYGLLNTVYTYDEEEVSGIPELHKGLISRSWVNNRHDESFRRAETNSEKHEVAKSTRQLIESPLVRPLSAPLTPSAL
ncbi:hypothetical protein H5410_042019 [Solanum commersonii]|uniref:Uncharacterized protein n=1 Tax=Solanum commersonii TaxID=4109 RepID=A0A9J5XTJ8_SOLCO|nr:hypothetical protein H5410_042019 [Solanum commersonii]